MPDPRSTRRPEHALALAFAMIASAAATRSPAILAAIGVAGAVAMRLRRVPLGRALQRLRATALVVGGAIALGAFASRGHALRDGGTLAARVLDAALWATWLVATHTAIELDGALRAVGVPRGLVALLPLTRRFGAQLQATMRSAWNASALRGGFRDARSTASSVGAIAGLLLVRALDRTERTALALDLRGGEDALFAGERRLLVDVVARRRRGLRRAVDRGSSASRAGRAMTALAVHVDSIGYVADVAALRDVHLEAASGEAIAVLGGNGAGKTALLHFVVGALCSKNGRTTVHGQRVASSRDAVRAGVGLVVQDPDDQLLGATVRQDVSLGPRNLRLDEAEVSARVDAALATVGIESLADREIESLSFGERKRTCLAGVLAMRARAAPRRADGRPRPAGGGGSSATRSGSSQRVGPRSSSPRTRWISSRASHRASCSSASAASCSTASCAISSARPICSLARACAAPGPRSSGPRYANTERPPRALH